jgi:hypothetical protein
VEKEQLEKIDKKLNVLIGLFVHLIDIKQNIQTPEKEKIKMLAEFKMDYEDIGSLFNKNAKQVAKQIYETKRKRSKK